MSYYDGRKYLQELSLSPTQQKWKLKIPLSLCDLIIMVGDYKTVLSSSMGRKGIHFTNYPHRALKEITNIMDTIEIVDI